MRPIDFTVGDGEFVVVVGPSGCGKTTLLKMIAGLLPPSEGEIRVENQTITKPHGGVGIVFQTAMLLPWRSVFSNVMMPVEVKGLPRESTNRAPTPCSRWLDCRISRTNIPGNYPAACNSAPQTAARWCTTRRSC